MIDISKINMSNLDRPEVCMFLFHPREQGPHTDAAGTDIRIPVAGDIHVGARFHMISKKCPNILFFHGNGEIVGDYNDLGGIYNSQDMNFMPVDYRGYGASNGSPTVTSMMRDAHVIFEFALEWLSDNGYKGPIILMGRSLGSASVLELANTYPDRIDGLIVESGFAYAGPLLRLIGVSLENIGFNEACFDHLGKIKTFAKPVLIIHAEHDHIIPFSDGQALFDACGSLQKQMLKIENANHNDIFYVGMKQYLAAVEKLAVTTLLLRKQ